MSINYISDNHFGSLSEATLPIDTSAKFLEEMKQNYSLQGVAETIKRLAEEGKKICLFIGRQGHELLPQEENSMWVSNDVDFAQAPFSSKRLHIWANLMEEENRQKFKGLFDKIVIDQSTCKMFNGDFIARFVQLLKISPNSQMIFERTPYVISFDEDISEPVNKYSMLICPHFYVVEDFKRQYALYDCYVKETEDKQRKKDLEEYKKLNDPDNSLSNDEIGLDFRWHIIRKKEKELNESSLENEALKKAWQDTKTHTEEFFQKVDLIEDQTFPYPTNYGGRIFFIATGIK